MKFKRLLIVVLVLFSSLSQAETYELTENDTVIGEMAKTRSRLDQTLPDIARIHDLGFNDIKRANLKVDTWIPGD